MPVAFVDAYSKTTGKKQRVPAYFLDHPVLGKNLRKTPLQTKREPPASSAKKTAAPARRRRAAQTPATGEDKE